jgi:hypothetical protein
LFVLVIWIAATITNLAVWPYDANLDEVGRQPLYVSIVLPPMAAARMWWLMGQHCSSSTGCLEGLGEDDEMLVIFFVLLVSGALLPFLGIYLDQVLPSDVGVRRSPCFCFSDCFNFLFRRNRRHERLDDDDAEAAVEDLDDPNEDVDVREERERVRSGAVTPAEYGVIIKRLHKRYGGGKVAVQQLDFAMKKNECFGLLGANGGIRRKKLNLFQLQMFIAFLSFLDFLK